MTFDMKFLFSDVYNRLNSPAKVNQFRFTSHGGMNPHLTHIINHESAMKGKRRGNPM